MGRPPNAAQRRFLWTVRLLFLVRIAVVIGVLVVLIELGVL